ncbi:MAG: DUF2971 domain-containing protein [Thalassolituus sp.]|jgi:hypothetical protein
MAALESGRLGFRNPRYFNDPLELSYYSRMADADDSLLEYQINEIQDSVAILSLTTSDENPLMWAHYGDEHRGFCIGYDVSCPFFSSDYCLIPASKGKVMYKDEKPVSDSPEFNPGLYDTFLQAVGLEENVTSKTEEIARKLYLTKSEDWEYEDEYRVVKITNSLFEESHVFQSDPLRHFTIPSKPMSEDSPHYHVATVPGLHIFSYRPKIRSITLGMRNTWESSSELLDFASSNAWKSNIDDAVINKVRPANDGWKFKSEILP